MPDLTEITWNSRNNILKWRLTDDSAVSGTFENTNLSSVTKMELVDGDTVVTSDSTSFFDWSAGSGVMSVALGGASLIVGTYLFNLIVYSTVNPLGVVWNEIEIVVRA